MIAEASMQNITSGAYVDISDIKKGFEFDHWADNVTEFAMKHHIK
ncbi:hypothetical protein SDC9_209672 [bioreactor metagenome]|uniref:Uncharacterized protein n=1 Tax=bioreactor metagenome TaxID=1076179 RepID=A0A645JEM7_9ZZZZ